MVFPTGLVVVVLVSFPLLVILLTSLTALVVLSFGIVRVGLSNIGFKATCQRQQGALDVRQVRTHMGNLIVILGGSWQRIEPPVAVRYRERITVPSLL